MLITLFEGNIGMNKSLAVSHNAVWIGSQQGYLVTVDITQVGAETVLLEQIITGALWDIAASENLIAVAADTGGVHLFDAHDPANQTLIGHYPTYDGGDYDYYAGQSAYAVAFVGQYLYVACEAHLKVVDISDPTAPTLVTTVNNIGHLDNRIVIVNDRAYIGESSGGTFSVRILDITNGALLAVVEP